MSQLLPNSHGLGPFKLAVLPGDGVGPEVTDEAVKTLQMIGDLRDVRFIFEYGLIGGCAIEETGSALPVATVELCMGSDAALVGAVGGPQWDHLPPDINPGPGGLLKLRQQLGLFANVRPAFAYVPSAVPIKSHNIDIVLVREAVGGLYFSPSRGRRPGPDGEVAFDTMEYTAGQVRRIVDKACRVAMSRGKKLTSVDKSNVLESSKLWRETAIEVSRDYPELEIEHLYVDNCAMQLILRPESFDVIVTENLFGDILSDELAGLVGSLGLLPSASLREDSWGLYEPVHGSAPDIAGKGTVNPAASILSASLLLRNSLGMASEADLIDRAVIETYAAGFRTIDVLGPKEHCSTTVEFGSAVRSRLEALLD